MRSKIVLIFLLVFTLGTGSMAYNLAIIGGVRDGTAIGLVLDRAIRDTTFKVGFEVSTLNSPIIFVGSKWYLADVNSKMPIFLSAGLVAYLGNLSEVGPYISVIFDSFLNIKPLFLELGVDFVKTGRLQGQMGYFF